MREHWKKPYYAGRDEAHISKLKFDEALLIAVGRDSDEKEMISVSLEETVKDYAPHPAKTEQKGIVRKLAYKVGYFLNR